MFQAKIRGWRRVAAGLVLVPGLTGVGADALGLIGRAAGQERAAANRDDEARDLMRRAREAYDAQNYGLARELADKARALRAPGGSYDDRGDEPAADTGKKPAARSAPPAAAAAARPAPQDPKVLTTMAKQAYDAGDLDKAHDLATKALPLANSVKWGLFEDTPASVLKDVAKARGRRDRDTADHLMTEARQLIDRPTASRNERAANLTLAEEKARQAAGLNVSFNVWDFGDRPGDLIADARKAREKEKLVAARTGDDEAAPTPAPRGSGYGSRKASTGSGDSDVPPSPAKSADANRKKAAIALMQEAKALEVGRHYVEAKRKYVEAARLNAAFGRDEDSPETELARLNVSAQRRINGLMDEAKSCLERKDAGTAKVHLDEAHTLAAGLGLDASLILEMKMSLKPASQVAKAPAKPVVMDEDLPPPPVIRTGSKGDDPLPVIRSGKPGTEVATEIKTAGGADEPPLAPIPPAKPEPSTDIKPIPTTKPMKADKADDLPPLPAVPDVSGDAEKVKAPAVEPPVKAPMPEPPVKAPMPEPPVKAPAKPDMSERGKTLLGSARTELRKGDTEAARKLAIELINGPYDAACKDEAKTILSSADTKEAGKRLDDAKRAFDKGQEAWVAGNYTQALAIFKEIDGAMLTAQDRKVMADMTAAAEAQKKKSVAVTGEPLPKAPKRADGVPDLPVSHPAPRTGSDNLVKQQEALSTVEFQRLRTKALRVESDATARFGKGETDEALMDLQNFVAEVKASKLEPAKQNMLCRPIEARMDRLRILKHQTDFLTKESKDRRNFQAQMTQEALAKEAKQKDVAALMKEANRLSEEHKYKEAYAKVQMAQSLDPDDATIQQNATITKMLLRKQEDKKNADAQEQGNFDLLQGMHDFGGASEKELLKYRDDPEVKATIERRLRSQGGNLNVIRSKSDADKAIERKMYTPITVNFKSVPLDDVVGQLRLMTGINFDLDTRALKEGNVDAKTPITADLKDVSLKSALNIICNQAGLRYHPENEAIRIATAKALSGRQTVKVMSVGDLVMAAPNFGAKPGLSLTEQLQNATNSAYGGRMQSAGSTPRNSVGSLPGGSATGSGSTGLPGIPGRIRNNTPEGGGVETNNNTEGSTLERELIRLITTTIKPDSWSQLGGEGTIEYFPLGMSMVINQSPEVIEEVERLLESLRKLQDLEVSIEVKVVSLAETFYERIGVDFAMGIPTNARPVGGALTGQTVFATNPQSYASGNVIGLQTPGVPTPDLDIPIRATSFNRAVPPFGGFSNSFQEGGISLGLAFLSECQVQLFLEAAQGDTRTNVMQAPKLTALNGTAASMTVGDYQFFLTGIQVANVAGQLVFTPQNVPYAVGITQPIPPNASIQNGLLNFTPTAPQTPGLGLFIQPVVSADRRFVRLNIQQSFTNLISGTQQIPVTTIITPVFENGGQGQPVPFTQYLQQPRFSNLETQTVVVVPDGGTVVMGGLKYMTEGRNEFGPPVLGKIPYLNRLFKNVAYGREGRSILIMVTPRVIINREEQERQTGVREDDFVGVAP